MSMPSLPMQPARDLRLACMAALLMALASLVAWWFTPTTMLVSQRGELKLESVIPRSFGDWQVDERISNGIVNPQQEALLRKLYSQTLTRTYVNRQGRHMMLSIAYGADQRDGMQLHYPEICYPAQGFQLRSNEPVTLFIGRRQLPARQLETSLGSQRPEPVTYWAVIGETAVRGGVPKKLAEMRYGLRGLIPDGLLFRVSSIDSNSAAAFEAQQAFATELLAAVPPAVRSRLAGADGVQ
jgi:EpsI family protein